MKIEIFTVDSGINSPCLEISGNQYFNLGYYSGNGSFFKDFENGNFISPNGGTGNKAGLLNVSILDIAGVSMSANCLCTGLANSGSGSGNGSVDWGGGLHPDRCIAVDCTNWSSHGGGGASSIKLSEHLLVNNLQPASVDNVWFGADGKFYCCDPSTGGGVSAGFQGDVHYFTSTYGAAGKYALVFRDDNLDIGSHWVIDWLEIDYEDNISAILSRRSTSNYFEGTSIATAFRVYGNPVGVAKQIIDSPDIVMKGLSVTLNSSAIIGPNPTIKYIGGMFVEFFRQVIIDNGPVGPNEEVIGRGVSFTNETRFRLVSESLEDLIGGDITLNNGALDSALLDYVNKLTSNPRLLNELCKISPFLTEQQIKQDTALINNLRLASSAASTNIADIGYYPQLMSGAQSYKIITRYLSFASNYRSHMNDTLSEIDNEGGGIIPVFPPKTGAHAWADARSAIIKNKLMPKRFDCVPCVEDEFRPENIDCSNPDNQFKAAFKIEVDNGNKKQIGPTNDCRCCGEVSEEYFWDNQHFCGRSDSLCLPLAVIQNGNFLGFSNYGFYHPVIPFFANKTNNMGAISKDITLREYRYVKNGKLLTGKFHVLNKAYPPNNSRSFLAKDFEPLHIVNGSDARIAKFMCNNKFRQNYESLPDQSLVYY